MQRRLETYFQGEKPVHLLAEESIDMHRSPATVFDYVANMERFGEWFPGVLSIESANDLAHGHAGKQYLETVAVPLRGERRIRLLVQQAERNRLFVTEGNFPPIMPRMEAKDGSAGFDFKGEFTAIIPYQSIHYTLGDDRTVEVQFVEMHNGVKVIETFEAEDENSAELQRQGWLGILNNFKRHVESKGNRT